MKHLRKYIFFVLMCLMCFEAKAVDPLQPLKLIHYDGCVNIGVPDTLLLRVENAEPNPETKGYYVWSIPDTWKPIGCVTCKELKVVTYETEAVTRVYRVGTHRSSGMEYAFDTVQVRGADTTLIILDDNWSYLAVTLSVEDINERFFEFQWYKQYLESDIIDVVVTSNKYLYEGEAPILAYRPKAGCWSVTDKVVKWGLVSLELQGQGCVRVNSGITYCEVNTQGKKEQQIGQSEVLHFEVRPAKGYYLDRVEIGNGEQMRVVSACDIEEKDGVFSFRDFPKWMNDFITEDYRIILKEGEKKNDPVCDDPVTLVHYDGCVNVGVSDTLLLRVENADARLRYRWQLPDTWEPIGDTNRGELRVITHETKDTTRIYGVKFADRGSSVFDTIQVKGADTTLYIWRKGDAYFALLINTIIASGLRFDLMWYKDNLSDENFVLKSWYTSTLSVGLVPFLKYRIKESNACWSVTDEVIHYNRRLKVEIVGKGQVRVYSGRIYVDVTKEGKTDGPVDGADTLRFIGKPSHGFYLDRIEVEDDEQVTVVPEQEIKKEADGTFSFRSSATWQDNKPHIDSISKENYRFVFVEKQHTIKDLGETTVCRGDSVKMGLRYVRQPGFHYDTVGGEMAKADTVYQLYLHVNPTYHDTLHFLVERDSMPYILGKDTIRNFGWTRFNALTVNGCDSITYVRLDTLYIHREQHFYDTLQTCGEAVLSWRGREITQTGDYADTVFDPYKGGTDSIHHLRADIYPSYQETLYFSTEPDSMPYIYGKDTIRQFGLTELQRYQTVHGCDSIIYVRLDTLYIHRERHFYDTLDACGEVVLSWRGREITQTGDYSDTVVDPYRGGTDSIYHLRADIYPTYQETLHFSTEPDSMPYIYGKDTIRKFGLTELQRYQTVNGCDSIIYVQLDPVYRAQHFYDTMAFCGTATVQWRGVKMIVYRTGDYIDSTSEADRGGAKNYYHLHVAISSPYSITYTDSCYIEELPYAVGGRPMEAYGTHTENLVSAAGCDSVCHYVLSRRWHWYRVNVKVRGEGSVNVTDTVLREDGAMWLAFTASACYALERVMIDGRSVSPQNRLEIKDLHGDCDVEVTFASLASAETRVERQACRDSLPIVYNGELYGEGEHTMMLRNAVGCDSVVKLYVQGKENAARLAVVDTIAPLCGVSEIAFSYNIEAGSPRWLRLAFDPVALSAGFRDTTMAVGSTGGQTVRLALPASAGPDRYGLRLWQTDVSGCYAPVDDMFFEIPYPSDIIVQKWSDVLAVLSAEYNGDYEFSGYQWYKNGEAIEGATRPYYQAKPYLRSSDTYAVLLERASDGLRLQSCGVKRKGYPKELSLELLPNPTASGEAVTVRVNGKPDAEGIIEVFDGIGKPVYERPFRESHILRADWQPGSYVVRVRNAKSTWMATGKLIVR